MFTALFTPVQSTERVTEDVLSVVQTWLEKVSWRIGVAPGNTDAHCVRERNGRSPTRICEWVRRRASTQVYALVRIIECQKKKKKKKKKKEEEEEEKKKSTMHIIIWQDSNGEENLGEVDSREAMAGYWQSRCNEMPFVHWAWSHVQEFHCGLS